jgi:hypothetical protein
MNLFNWFAKEPQKKYGSTVTVETAQEALELYRCLSVIYLFLKRYILGLIDSEGEILQAIEELKTRTKQEVDVARLMQDLTAIRFAFLHSWLFQIKPANNQVDTDENLSLINHAVRAAFAIRGRSDDVERVEDSIKGYLDISNDQEITANMFEDSRFAERVGAEIPTAVFNVTGGRLGGELYEGLLRLIMETVELDKKSFTLDSERSLTPEESANLDDMISKTRLPKEVSLDEFLSSF